MNTKDKTNYKLQLRKVDTKKREVITLLRKTMLQHF